MPLTHKILLPIFLAAAVTAPGFALAAQPAVPPWGVELAYVQPEMKPGEDFFAYGNGGWLKTAEIPADRSYAGVNLELNLQNEARLKGILGGLAAGPTPALDSEPRKLRDLYLAFMDLPQIEARGLQPARRDLARIARLSTRAAVARAMNDPALALDGPFTMGLAPDDKNPAAYAVRLYQSGLGMPDRDYYLRDDSDLAATRAAYRTYLATTLGYAGIAHPQPRAAAVFKLETALAKASWAAADRRDADKIYNPMTVAQLRTLAPDFPWTAYLSAAGLRAQGPHGDRLVIVSERSAFPALAKVFAQTPIAVWRDFLTVRYLHAFAEALPRRIDEADFAFYGAVIGGRTQQLDRATRGVDLIDRRLGEALGKLYVARYFPPEAKAKADLLVHNLLAAYAEDIKTLAWMTPATREKALDKLDRYLLKIGYPDHWRDYSALAISRDALIGDLEAANVFEWTRQLKRIDAPVDRAEWDMTPSTNNAYYAPNLNEIVFPAGILQPPFFDASADDAVNYAEIGATIGHEISHGFDDQGSKFDGSGALKSWWTDDDRRNFDARTAALALQYDAYEPLPGLHVNGKLTLGENIADLAGLVIAHRAYHIALGGKPAPVLDGLTGDQRFYIAYAQSWREVWRPGRTRQIVLSNPHSPSRDRVNGVVRNDDSWYQAFPMVAPGDHLWLSPEARVRLW